MESKKGSRIEPVYKMPDGRLCWGMYIYHAEDRIKDKINQLKQKLFQLESEAVIGIGNGDLTIEDTFISVHHWINEFFKEMI